MKLSFSEVLVAIACLVAVVALLLSLVSPLRPNPRRIDCRINLRDINEAFRIWEEDNGGQYPMATSVTNGGAMELIKAGDVAGCFQVASNELSTTKLLVCPEDPEHMSATNWNDLNNSNLSYFLSRDVTNESNPGLIVDGDDNFEFNGSPVKPGLFALSPNSSVDWAAGRHSETFRRHFWFSAQRIYFGNIGFADGHVEQLTTRQLKELLQNIDPQTNRIAIP